MGQHRKILGGPRGTKKKNLGLPPSHMSESVPAKIHKRPPLSTQRANTKTSNLKTNNTVGYGWVI